MNKMCKIKALIRFYLKQLFCPSAMHATGRNYFSKGCLKIFSGASCQLGSLNALDKGYDVEIKGQLTIGSRNYFNKNVKIVCLERIEIGDDCIIADSVHFYDHDHNYGDVQRLIREQGYKTKPIRVGNNVWIGAKATILKGVTIGDGAVIGAHAVVTKDIPANALAVGNPAAIVKIRAANV